MPSRMGRWCDPGLHAKLIRYGAVDNGGQRAMYKASLELEAEINSEKILNMIRELIGI